MIQKARMHSSLVDVKVSNFRGRYQFGAIATYRCEGWRFIDYGDEDVFGGGYDDGHACGEIVELTGLELSPPQCWLIGCILIFECNC